VSKMDNDDLCHIPTQFDRRTPEDTQATVVTATVPSRLTKEFSIQNGDLQRSTGGVLVEGSASVLEFKGLDGFKDILMSLGTDQALIYGQPKERTSTKLISEKMWLDAGRPDDAIPRKAEYFCWANGRGIMMLDYDPEPDTLAMCRDDLVAAIQDVIPGLANASMVWWPSASSHIKNKETGEDLTGLRGQRLYILVADARDIPRAGEALVETLWACGYGHIEISKSGAYLERTIIDSSVWQTNRFDFAAGAACTAPLYQDRGDPIILSGEIEVVNTAVAIPDPSPELQATAIANKEQAKKAKSDEAVTIREKWLGKKIDGQVGKNADENARKATRDDLIKALDYGVLKGDFKITIVGDFGEREVSVNELLDDPVHYHGMLTKDPIELDYQNGKTVGKLYLLGSKTNLFSFAHGGRNYKLVRELSRIELVRGRTHDNVNETLACLRKAPEAFDLGGTLVKVEEGRVSQLDEPGLGHLLGGINQYWRWQKLRNDELIEVLEDPPPRVLKPILSMGMGRKLKQLTAVITAPTLRPDGTVFDTPGYDAETGLLFEAEEELAPVPTTPTKQQVKTALGTLIHPFKNFPFASVGDQGVFLAALLTAVVRPALPTAPAFGLDAPVQASGKTLLALCIAMLATGQIPTVWPHTAGRDDEEVRKRLITALSKNALALIWDNLVGQFDSPAMAAALTAPMITDRILGKSESVSIPNRAITIFTGNNLTLTGDLTRRVLRCRIDPKSDRPFARRFDLDPLAYVEEHRQEMVRAALTIIRGYLSSGKEPAVGRMASFELWDDYVRQTVAWVDKEILPGLFTDPMVAVMWAQTSDPEQEALSILLSAWHVVLGNGSFTARDALTEIFQTMDQSKLSAKAQILETLKELNHDRDVISAQALGRLLGYRKDRIVDGRCLEAKTDPLTNQKLWSVKNVP
jgi:hypothetical protein